MTAGAVGVIFLFAAAGAVRIKAAGWSVAAASLATFLLAGGREMTRLSTLVDSVPAGQLVFAYADAATLLGGCVALFAGIFALRVGMRGNAAFAAPAPRRMRGRRAVHGDADWMKMNEAEKLFPDAGGIVIGERYRVDRDTVAEARSAPKPATHGESADDLPCSASTEVSDLRMALSLPGRAASRRHL